MGLNRALEVGRSELARSDEHADQSGIHRRADVRDDVIADHRDTVGRQADLVDQRREERRLGLAEYDGRLPSRLLERGEKRTDVELKALRCLPVARAAKTHEPGAVPMGETERAIQHADRPTRLEVADEYG